MPVSDAGFKSLEGMLGGPMEIGTLPAHCHPIASASGRLHQHRLVHRDIKPANILVNSDQRRSSLHRPGPFVAHRAGTPAPSPPEVIAGTLAYMAPEQTGRMNRSIDSRSDLYALGVTLYEMLTGALPFAAPIRWSGCTATSPGSRCRRPSGCEMSRPRSRPSS